MNLSAIATARLISQQIEAAKFTKPKDLVTYMGAIQAQDYAMAKWAIGLRLPGSTEKQIEKGFAEKNKFYNLMLLNCNL